MYHLSYSILFTVLLLIAPPALFAGTDCACEITKKDDVTTYSRGCSNKRDICTLTIGKGVGLIDLSAFTDLRDATVTVFSGAHPGFLATTLVNNNTIITLNVLDGVAAADASVRILQNAEVVEVFDDQGDFNLLGGQLLNLGICLDADLKINLLGGIVSANLTAAQTLACTFMGVFTGTLPVELVTWTAQSTATGILLDWQTASETDNDYYGVSHSTDGTTYTELGRVVGRGTTGRPGNYRYRHAFPAPGTNYYRLEQVDFDGVVETLGIQSAEWEAKPAATVSCSPNPVTAGALLRLNGLSFIAGETVSLLNGTGRLVGRHKITPEGYLRVSPNIVAGIYFLRYREQATKISIIR